MLQTTTSCGGEIWWHHACKTENYLSMFPPTHFLTEYFATVYYYFILLKNLFYVHGRLSSITNITHFTIALWRNDAVLCAVSLTCANQAVWFCTGRKADSQLAYYTELLQKIGKTNLQNRVLIVVCECNSCGKPVFTSGKHLYNN